MAKDEPDFPDILDHPHLREFREFIPQVDKESPRGEVPMTAAYLHELLRRNLVAFFVSDPQHEELMEDATGPVASFSSRIKLCGALGLLQQKEAEEFHRLGRIRNRFSHETHVSFDDQRIRDWCKNLTHKAHDYKHPTMGDISPRRRSKQVVLRARKIQPVKALDASEPHHLAIVAGRHVGVRREDCALRSSLDPRQAGCRPDHPLFQSAGQVGFAQ